MAAVEAEYGQGTVVSKSDRGSVSVTHYGAGPSCRAPLSTLESGRALLAAPDVTLVSAARLAAVRAADDEIYFSPGAQILLALARKRLAFGAEDIRALLVRAARSKSRSFSPQLAPTVTITERWAKLHGTREIEHELRALLDSVLARPARFYERERTAVANRLRLLIGDQQPDLTVMDERDDFGRRARQLVASLQPSGVAACLLHLVSATASRPAESWLKRAIALVQDAEAGEDLIRGLLEEAAAAELRTGPGQGVRDRHFVLTEANSTLLRGAIWTSAALEVSWAFPVITRILERSANENAKITNACVYSLGSMGTREALTTLSQTRGLMKDRAVLKQIDSAPNQAAKAAGLSQSEQRETLAPTLGLDENGSRLVSFGVAIARVSVIAPGTVSTTWTVNGEAAGRVPSWLRQTHTPELRVLASDTKTLRGAVGVERRRVEDLFTDDREWELSRWERRYRQHPLVRPIAENLIWTFNGISAIVREDQLVDVGGHSLRPESGTTVRLWHPLLAEVEEIKAWQAFFVERAVVQPFKQAHREIYLVAPAEVGTGTYSNRFAAHLVHYSQTYALIKQRGWGGAGLGRWDGGSAATVFRDFSAHGVRAELDLRLVHDAFGSPLAELASTGQVQFRQLSPDRDLLVADVPPIVFSEAMRDVDLFVGVSSIAADDEWLDGGERRLLEYRERSTRAVLTESGVARRELLRDLLPNLTIADRCELEDRFLVVRGTIRTYRVHLGSGNVLMEPNAQYLCIVPQRRSRSELLLPFEGDDRLTTILSKAFMLAADHEIKDEAIIHQITR